MRPARVGRSTSMAGHQDRVIMLKNDLETVRQKLDRVSAQLLKTEAERDAYKEIIDLETGDSEKNSNSAVGKFQENEREKEFELLKKQYVEKLRELEILRYENSGISEKYEEVCQQCENNRKYKMLYQNLQRRFEQINTERNKLQQEYEEIVLLREREKIEMKDNQQYEKYLKNQSKHNLLLDRFQNLEGDYSALKIQFDDVMDERESLLMERNGLKQQSDAAIKKYDKAMKDCEIAMKKSIQEKQQAQQQRDSARRECDQVMALQVKTAKDITKLTEERNAAVSEYKLVMSERDTVHLEIENLHDELSNLRKTNEKLKRDYADLQNHLEDSQGEISLLVEERMQASKEVQNLKDRLHLSVLEKENILKEQRKLKEDNDMFKQERNVARRERSEAIIHRDKILKECFEIKRKHQLALKGENGNASLRKQFDALTKDLTDALNNIEDAKRTRDCALNDRDKVTKEYELLKIRFDKMQSDRDQAISNLADLRHESEHIQRKHAEAVAELFELRSHIEVKLNQGSLLSSRDSAIDTDCNVSYKSLIMTLEP